MITPVNILFFLLIIAQGSSAQKLSEFDCFLGCWQLQKTKQLVYECYQKQPLAIVGKNFSIENKDTLLIENLAIIKSMQKWYLSTQVVNQNKGRNILFELIGKTDNTFIFENTMHDFPQKIIYQFISETEMEAEISGKAEDKIRINTFKFIKTKSP